MKKRYNLKKMKRIPHPFLNTTAKLVDNVSDISDSEFEKKLKGLSPDERALATRQRQKQRKPRTVSSCKSDVSESASV